MKKEMFEMILQKDEEIVWGESVNRKAFNTKKILKSFFILVVLSLFFAAFIGAPIAGIISSNNSDVDEISLIFQVIGTLWLVFFGISFTAALIITCLNAKNTFFAITNKRIIKRSGAFNNKFMHYSLKNVGNVEVIGSLFDSKGKHASANLIITTKDFHNNTDGNSHPIKLTITSLNNAYEAYRIITEKTEGNNEVLRVKTEK